MDEPDNTGKEELSVRVQGAEVFRLYRILKERELELERPLIQLLDRIESLLYTRLSIDDIEKLQSFQKK